MALNASNSSNLEHLVLKGLMLSSPRPLLTIIAFIRPPDIVVGALIGFTAILLLLSSSFSFFVATLRAPWTKLNQTWLYARKWVRFENACPKSGVYPPPKNWRPQNHLFRRLHNRCCNSNGNFDGLRLWKKTWYT